MTAIQFSIPLTQGLFALVDEEDFEWLMQWKWCVLKTANATYAKRTHKAILMHRVIMTHHDSLFDVVDHWNHNGLDNRKSNLRPCTSSQNMANARKGSGTSSRFKGVHFETQTGRWRPEVRHNGKRLRGPRLDSEVEAAAWYDKKAVELFGEFALINGVKL